MKPVKFKEANVTFAKDQPEYLDLPAASYDGVVTSCWKLTFWERVKVLFNGRIWLSNLTFNNPLQPQKISVDSPFAESENS